MNRTMRLFTLLLALGAFFSAAPARAQAQDYDYERRAADLVALSGSFGLLHHIRRLCEPRREAELWRDRMRRLVALETPQPAQHERMVEAFNAAFREAEAAYPYCDRDARDRAAAEASRADAAATRLVTPLYDSLARSGSLAQ